jgi:hypothetical protein
VGYLSAGFEDSSIRLWNIVSQEKLEVNLSEGKLKIPFISLKSKRNLFFSI